MSKLKFKSQIHPYERAPENFEARLNEALGFIIDATYEASFNFDSNFERATDKVALLSKALHYFEERAKVETEEEAAA